MNKLSQTLTFQRISKALPSLKDQLNPANFPKYTIPINYYDSYFNIIGVKKYPLVQPTIKAAKAGKIRLLNHADPYNFNDKKSILSDSLSTLVVPSKDGDYIVYVNAMKKTGYVRNVDKEPVGLKINEVSLHAYLQSGYISYLFAKKDAEITNNIKLQTLMAEFYASAMSYVIDKMYPISGENNAPVRLNFLLAMYYLQVMCGYDLEKSLKIALTVKNVDPVVIGNDSRAFQSEQLVMKDFEDFLESFKTEFPFVKRDSVTLHSMVHAVQKYYGSSAMYAVEHSQSFMNMIMHARFGSGIYNDKAITGRVPSPLVKNIESILLLISGEV